MKEKTMNALAAKVAIKAEQAQKNFDSLGAAAVALAAEGASAKNWAGFANSLAEAEGKLQYWATLNQIAENKGDDFDQAAINNYTVRLLRNGADDGWSGRGNDVQRARFDGIRDAVDDSLYL